MLYVILCLPFNIILYHTLPLSLSLSSFLFHELVTRSVLSVILHARKTCMHAPFTEYLRLCSGGRESSRRNQPARHQHIFHTWMLLCFWLSCTRSKNLFGILLNFKISFNILRNIIDNSEALQERPGLTLVNTSDLQGMGKSWYDIARGYIISTKVKEKYFFFTKCNAFTPLKFTLRQIEQLYSKFPDRGGLWEWEKMWG